MTHTPDPGSSIPRRPRGPPALSVVVPVLDEEPNVAPLAQAVRDALAEAPAWELLFVDDGSRDGTAKVVRRLTRDDPRIRLIPLARNYGQSTALQAGFDHARGDVVVTLDGDLQNDPADIPRLLARLEQGYDLVAGYRVRRQDAWTRKVPSWVANRIIHRVTRVPIRDNGCSLKAYRREVVERLALYADLHRFIPAVAAATAGARIAELDVRHHPRRHGRSKYGFSRIWRVLADLVTLVMIGGFRERPINLFGGAALVAAAAGTLALGAAGVRYAAGGAVDNALVLPAVALLCFALACFFVMLGFIGETVLRQSRAARTALAPLARRVG